jgi:hypothetical protein
MAISSRPSVEEPALCMRAQMSHNARNMHSRWKSRMMDVIILPVASRAQLGQAAWHTLGTI